MHIADNGLVTIGDTTKINGGEEPGLLGFPGPVVVPVEQARRRIVDAYYTDVLGGGALRGGIDTGETSRLQGMMDQFRNLNQG